MPDHVHLLVHGQHAAADLHRFVKSAKQSTGQAYARLATPPLWQESYVDRVVRPEESLIGIARYILENPAGRAWSQQSGTTRMPVPTPGLSTRSCPMDEWITR